MNGEKLAERERVRGFISAEKWLQEQVGTQATLDTSGLLIERTAVTTIGKWMPLALSSDRRRAFDITGLVPCRGGR